MLNSSFASKRLMITIVLFSAACSKPKPSASAQDFARRHQCPVQTLESDQEASDRLRVTGCGKSEIYVRKCEKSRAAFPATDSRRPVDEAEARATHTEQSRSTLGEEGCAWSRQQNTSAPGAAGSQQPKWLSEP